MYDKYDMILLFPSRCTSVLLCVCILYQLAIFLHCSNFILLLCFNHLESLTGSIQNWCINDPEQLFLRIPMKHYVFLTKMFLRSQINVFLLKPLQP